MMASRWGFSRQRLDEYALASHAAAAKAQDAAMRQYVQSAAGTAGSPAEGSGSGLSCAWYQDGSTQISTTQANSEPPPAVAMTSAGSCSGSRGNA